jgi:HSP20 family molecular chaperone IbpA
MWERARELLEQADRIQRHFFHLGRPRYGRPTWEPPVDIFETEDEFWIIAALPGVEPKRVEVVIDGSTVIIAGDRGIPPQCQMSTVHRLEIPHGRFERRVDLPPGRFEAGAWELIHGCLFLPLKKKP